MDAFVPSLIQGAKGLVDKQSATVAWTATPDGEVCQRALVLAGDTDARYPLWHVDDERAGSGRSPRCAGVNRRIDRRNGPAAAEDPVNAGSQLVDVLRLDGRLTGHDRVVGPVARDLCIGLRSGEENESDDDGSMHTSRLPPSCEPHRPRCCIRQGGAVSGLGLDPVWWTIVLRAREDQACGGLRTAIRRTLTRSRHLATDCELV